MARSKNSQATRNCVALHRDCSAWAALWQSDNKLDGKTRHIIHRNLLPALFKTRGQARAYIEKEYGYIRNRPDLKSEPHGWRVPKAIRVTITPNAGTQRPGDAEATNATRATPPGSLK